MAEYIPDWIEDDKKYFYINVKGQEYENEGQIEKAIKIYELGIKLGTDTPATWNRLFNLYKEQGDINNMKRIMEYAFKKEKDDPYQEKNRERKLKAIQTLKAKLNK